MALACNGSLDHKETALHSSPMPLVWGCFSGGAGQPESYGERYGCIMAFKRQGIPTVS